MISLSIFGSTGSVGETSLRVFEQQLDKFELDCLVAGSNVDLLIQQAKKYRPKLAVIQRAELLQKLSDGLAGEGIEVASGQEAVLAAAERPVDTVMSAIVGFDGLAVSVLAAKHCKTLALANKESLVSGGQLLNRICKDNGTNLLPVDSEHSAIFQCLNGDRRDKVERVILTASGGPFLDKSLEYMRTVSVAEARAHPNWSMGLRISIDSASMFNKGMELIEAKEMFDLQPDQMEVIVHPQSIIHSMVGYSDGAIMAQLGPPDMAGAIGYALNYPDRGALDMERLDFAKLGQLEFMEVDRERFPAVRLAEWVLELGGLSGCVYNAAKEQALDLFLSEQVQFTNMANLVEKSLEWYQNSNNSHGNTLQDVTALDHETRQFVISAAKGNLSA